MQLTQLRRFDASRKLASSRSARQPDQTQHTNETLLGTTGLLSEKESVYAKKVLHNATRIKEIFGWGEIIYTREDKSRYSKKFILVQSTHKILNFSQTSDVAKKEVIPFE